MGTIMKRYKVPTTGSTITVTTRYKSQYLYDDKEYDEYTYTDVEVLPPYDWMTREEFRIKDFERMGHNIFLTDRVINVKNIVTMSPGELEEVDEDDNRVVHITSKRTNEVYDITIENGVATECTCKGFTFRKRCSHLKAATEPKLVSAP